MKVTNVEASLNFVSRDLQPRLQSVGIDQTDEAQKRSGAMAESQTGSGRAEGLQRETVYLEKHRNSDNHAHRVWCAHLYMVTHPVLCREDGAQQVDDIIHGAGLQHVHHPAMTSSQTYTGLCAVDVKTRHRIISQPDGNWEENPVLLYRQLLPTRQITLALFLCILSFSYLFYFFILSCS